MPELQTKGAAGAETCGGRQLAADLVALAAQGLPQMVDPASGLFCHRLLKTETGVEREGVSHRYTMMTLLGLHRYEQAGGKSPLRTAAMLEALLQDLNWLSSAGDLGLLLWTCAMVAPDRLPETAGRLKPGGAIDRYADGRRVSTMEVAWVLAGAAHCALAGFRNEEVQAEGERAYRLLKENRGASGLFGHMASGGDVAGMLRGRIGSFADQVYPIYALSTYSQANGDREARDLAADCGAQICGLQGDSGEWWWHYDAARGRVASYYPVYSVHQHAMGPMALLALSKVSGDRYRKPLMLGLDWIAGQNELQLDMRDETHNVVWRSIYQNRPIRYAHEVLHMVGWRGRLSSGLTLRQECRPYELGWLLYALTPPV